MASLEEIAVISLADKEMKGSMENEEVALEEGQAVIEAKGRTEGPNGRREVQIMVDLDVTSLKETEDLKGDEEGKETTISMDPRNLVVATSRSMRASR